MRSGHEIEAATKRKNFRLFLVIFFAAWIALSAILFNSYGDFCYQKGFEAGAKQSKELASSLEFMLKDKPNKIKIDTFKVKTKKP